jgi:PAS domain S-box-containing protein
MCVRLWLKVAAFAILLVCSAFFLSHAEGRWLDHLAFVGIGALLFAFWLPLRGYKVLPRPTSAPQADERETREHSFKLVLDSIPAFIHTMTPMGEVDLVNDRVLEYFGLPLEELKDWRAVTHPDDVVRVSATIEESLNTGSACEFETRGLRADGVYRWFHARGVPVRDASGSILRWCYVFTDVDDRKRAEESVRSSERNLRLVLDSIPAFVHATTATGELELVNKPVMDYFGLPFEALEDFKKTTHPDDVERVTGDIARALRTGLPLETESRGRRADGVYRWFAVRGLPVRNEAGEIVRWYNVLTDIDDRKRAEEALRASERNLRLILDSIPGLVHTTTPAGEIEEVNQRTLDFFGVTLEALRQWPDITHPDDVERVVADIQRSLRTGLPLETESRGRRADGVFRWFSVRGLPLRNENGEIVRWYQMLTDIDDRKRAEEALRASEQHLRLMVDSIPGLICTNTSAGAVEHVNKPLLDYTGRPLSELFNWAVVVHSDDLPIVAEHWAHSIATGAPFDVEVRVCRRDGVYRWFHCRGRPVRNDEGEILRWYNLLTDIEDRKHAEDMLRAREHELALIIETIPAMVWCAAPDGSLTYANTLTLKYSGVTYATLFADPYDYIHPDDLVGVTKMWDDALQDQLPYESRYRMRRADGEYRWVHSMGRLGRDDSGHPTRWYGVLIDVHDRVQMEEVLRDMRAQLARATQVAALGELSAAIAHEINQPLAAVVTNGHVCHTWLMEERPNIPRALVNLERMIRDAKSAAEVIQRIRALYRHASLRKSMLSVNEVIEEVCELISSDLRTRSIQLRTVLDRTLPDLCVDRVQLQHVLSNLTRNAIEAMESSGSQKELCITSYREDQRIVVRVEDTGIGMDNFEQAFEPFFTTKDNGMGMGLAICRSIIEAHGGKLWAGRRGERGAVFSFALPLAAQSSQLIG